MAKILWIADAGCTTGFARATHAIGDRLADTYGHEVHALATNYRGDPWPTPMQLWVPTLKSGNDLYGKTRILELLVKIDPDVVITLNDPQVLLQLLFENQYDPENHLLRYRPIIAYLPVDGHNRPPAWQLLSQVTNTVAMSRFGQAALPGSKLVYHGVDPDLFWPVSSQLPIKKSDGMVVRSKREAKVSFGYPADSFLVLRVDRNSGRKDFPATWKALVPVMQRHSDIWVHFHCRGGRDSSGVELSALWSRSLATRDRFRIPDMFDETFGWEQPDLNALYNAADLFVTTSRGEGFGLTIAEALCCGVPVIAQNVSAIPEVVGPGGTLLEPQREITVPSGEDQWLADVDAFSDAIEQAYSSRKWRRDTGAAGREHVTKSFSWDFAADRFHEYVSALSEGKVLTHGKPADEEGGVQNSLRPTEGVRDI